MYEFRTCPHEKHATTCDMRKFLVCGAGSDLHALQEALLRHAVCQAVGGNFTQADWLEPFSDWHKMTWGNMRS